MTPHKNHFSMMALMPHASIFEQLQHMALWRTRPVTRTGQLAWQRLAHHIKNFNVKTLTFC